MATPPDQTPTPAPLDDWLGLLVLLQQVQERLAHDRQEWAETGGDMAYLVEALRTELQKLQALESEVDQKIMRGCQKAIYDQAAGMSHHLTMVVRNAFESTIQRLEQVAQKAINQQLSFQNYRRQFMGWCLGLVLILCIFSSMSGGCIVHLLYPPDRLSAEQWQLIQDGTILRKSWPHLSKKEQDKIMDLFNGKDGTR